MQLKINSNVIHLICAVHNTKDLFFKLNYNFVIPLFAITCSNLARPSVNTIGSLLLILTHAEV